MTPEPENRVEFEARTGGSFPTRSFDTWVTWPQVRFTIWATGVTAEVGVLGDTWSLLWAEMAGAQFDGRRVLMKAKIGRGAMIFFRLHRQQDRLVDALMNHRVPVEEVRSLRFKNY